MRDVEEFRKYFINAKSEDIQILLHKIHAAQGAAYADHNLSPQIDRGLRKSLAEIAGLSEKDKEELIQIADKYTKETYSEAKDKRPYAVPIKKKKNILAKLLIGATATSVIGGGICLLIKALKNNDEE